MDLKTFLSVLLVYRSNFEVLHWMAEGKNFFMLHGKAEEFTSMISNDIDVVAEMSLRLEDGIVNYEEALKLIAEYADHEFLLIESNKLFATEDFCKYTEKMFNDILGCIRHLLDSNIIQESKNVGIKASLESMYDKYDLQCRYLIKRFKD